MVYCGDRTDLPVALVVGACGGMGVAIARRLGQQHMVLLADLDGTKAARFADSFHDEGYSAIAIQCDVTRDDSVAAAFETVRLHGGLRVLAHVVALSPSMADWRTIMAVNLVGATRVVDAAEPIMDRGGAAVLISSVGGYMIRPTPEECAALDSPSVPDFLERLIQARGGEPDSLVAYMLAKNGLMRLCRRRAVAWGVRGARISSLSPGFIQTPMGDREFEHQPIKRQYMPKIPAARLGTVSEIADAVEFLASRRASYITGTDLLVDGGLNAVL